MACLLLEIKTAVEAAKEAGATELEAQALAGYLARYREIIAAGYARNPEPARTGKRGRPRQGPVRSLLLRLDRREDDVLRVSGKRRRLVGDPGIVEAALVAEARADTVDATVIGPTLAVDLDNAEATLILLGSMFHDGYRIEGDPPPVEFRVPDEAIP